MQNPAQVLTGCRMPGILVASDLTSAGSSARLGSRTAAYCRGQAQISVCTESTETELEPRMLLLLTVPTLKGPELCGVSCPRALCILGLGVPSSPHPTSHPLWPPGT